MLKNGWCDVSQIILEIGCCILYQSFQNVSCCICTSYINNLWIFILIISVRYGLSSYWFAQVLAKCKIMTRGDGFVVLLLVMMLSVKYFSKKHSIIADNGTFLWLWIKIIRSSIQIIVPQFFTRFSDSERACISIL